MAQITTVEQLRAIVPEPVVPVAAKIRDHLDGQALAFIEAAPFLLLSTIGADGHVEVSPKGDAPGFVVAEDDKTLLIPDRDGNKLALGHLNVLTNPHVGLIFMRPRTGETLRVSGRASLHDDKDLCARLGARGKPATLIIRVAVTRAYFHCARSILRAQLWEPESWGPAQRVSFGRLMKEVLKADDATAQAVDTMVDESYRDL